MKQYSWLYVVILILISLIVIFTASKKCGCGQLESFCGCGAETFCGCSKRTETFTGCVETAKPSSIYCAERLVYNGRNYELWRDSRVTHVFRTYDDYMAYLKFANASNVNKGMPTCIPLKPMTTSGFDGVIGAYGQGSIVATQYIQEPRFYNLEHFVSAVEGFESQRDVAVDSSTLLLESEKQNKNQHLEESQEILAEYMSRNPGCYEKIKDKSGDFYRIFQESYAAFIRHQFLRRLGYVPERPDLRDLNVEEAATYVEILKQLPACQALILNYSPYAQQPSPNAMKGVSSLFVREGFEDSSEESNTSESEEPQNKSVHIELDMTPFEGVNRFFDSVKSTVKGVFTGKIQVNAIKMPSVTVVDTEESPSTVIEKPGKSSNKVADSDANYGTYTYDAPKPQMPMHRPPVPKQMPSAKRSLDGAVERLPYEYDLRESSIRREFRAPVVAPSEDMHPSDKKLVALSQGRMQPIGSTDLDLDYIAKKAEPGVASDHIASNFAYTPDMEKPEKEMSPEEQKRIATTYGWSFIPPQFWSVPQKRPPICLPETGKVSNVVPIYDKSVPIDVLEWTKPKYETEEDIQRRPVDPSLRASYYAPGLYMTRDQHTIDGYTNGEE